MNNQRTETHSITHADLEPYPTPRVYRTLGMQRLAVLGAAAICFLFAIFSPSSSNENAVIVNNAWCFYAAFSALGIVRVVVSSLRKEKQFWWWLYTTLMLMSPLWVHGILGPLVNQAIHY